MKRSHPLRRTRLRRRGARARSEAEAAAHFRDTVLRRSGSACERCGARKPLHAHHIVPRARGGSHDPQNGLALCARCHSGVHDHTAPDWETWIQ